MTFSATTTIRNQWLRSLPASELQRVLPHLQMVSLRHGETVYDVGDSIRFVYFPERCVLSALTVMADGCAIEVGTIGNEGLSGISVLGESSTSLHRVVAQIPGASLRITADRLRREALQDGSLRDRLFGYQQFFLAQVSQSVACNGLHPIQKRCCRWLLMTHDRLDADTLPLTHEYLAMMLGVRRAGVSEVLQSLQEQDVIRTSRGKITVTDRPGLEARCCECYGKVRKIYQRLLG